ncbi:MAG: ABC-F family ATP-binding cassette domain-containing protein [Caldisericia bacterium]|nr:ABC-F family ATP-binding cassette domain-containing protein [Caldisericia bacterium]
MIDIQNLELQFGNKTIFDQINFQIPDGAKLAITGVNGAGKTTLFRCISGEEDGHRGKIIINGTHTIGYLPQDMNLLSEESLLGYFKKETGIDSMMDEMKKMEKYFGTCGNDDVKFNKMSDKYERVLHDFTIRGGYSFDAHVQKILNGLGFQKNDIKKKCSEFSGGWKMRIYLAKILLMRPDIMLLDEPTNHLDTESIEWLEQYLRKYEGTMIAISHDRMFLDNCITATAELSNGHIQIYSGNYSFFLKQSGIKKELLIKQKKEQDEWIEKTKRFIDRFRYKPTKASAVQSRVRQLEKTKIIVIEQKPKTVTLRFPTCTRSGLKAVELLNVSKKYNDNLVLDSIDLNVERGEKVALVGVNGSGKSTLSRLISKIEEPTHGKINIDKNIFTGFYAQESAQNVNYENTLWDEIQSIETKANDKEKRNLLGAFLFKNDDMSKQISVLSGGEKSRLALCKILLLPQNLLILDEPGNHLDMYTKEIFHRALIAYEGTLIIVSHDRFFLDNVANRIVEIHEHKLTSYMGNYSYFIKKRSENIEEFFPKRKKGSSKNVKRSNGNEHFKNDSYLLHDEAKKKTKDQKRIESEYRKKLFPYKEKLNKAEKELDALESKKKEIENDLCKPGIHSNSFKLTSLTRDLSDIKHTISIVFEEWELAQNELTEMKVRYPLDK